MRFFIVCFVFAYFFAPFSAQAKTVDERVADLENRINSIQQTYLTNNTDVAKAVARSETVEQEFTSLKGTVETNSHLLESQRQELMKLLRDLEHRIQAIEDRMQIFSTQINAAVGKVNPAAAEEGRLYQNGLDKAERGEYLNAAAEFQTFLKKYPRSTFAPTAQYWIGECFYSMKDFKRAIKEFQVFIQNNPRNEKVASAFLKQGNSFYELGMADESKPFYEKVIKDYPNSSEASQAAAKIQKISQPTAAAQPLSTSPPASPSYPTETIEQQRMKYQQTPTQGAQPTQPATPQKKETRYNEF